MANVAQKRISLSPPDGKIWKINTNNIHDEVMNTNKNIVNFSNFSPKIIKSYQQL